MEAWRDELYHALKLGSFSLPKIGIKSIGGKTSGNGEWKQHKYIRKEGNKYIYPEDLKKKEQSLRESIQPNNSSTANGKIRALSDKYDRIHGTDTYKGREARTALTDVKSVIKSVNTQNHGASDNKAHASRYYADSKVSERYSVSLEYKNGKQWFDSMTVNNSTEFLKAPVSDISLSREYDQTFTYNYGYFHQAANAGKNFVKKLLDPGWNKYRPSDAEKQFGKKKG